MVWVVYLQDDFIYNALQKALVLLNHLKFLRADLLDGDSKGGNTERMSLL